MMTDLTRRTLARRELSEHLPHVALYTAILVVALAALATAAWGMT